MLSKKVQIQWKGTPPKMVGVLRDCLLQFFWWFEPIWAPWQTSQSIFKLFFNFGKIIELLKNYAVCITLWSQFSEVKNKISYRSPTPQGASYCGVRLHGVHQTVEPDSAVCITLWCALHTAETYCTPQSQNFNFHLSLVDFKRTIRSIKCWFTTKICTAETTWSNISAILKNNSKFF